MFWLDAQIDEVISMRNVERAKQIAKSKGISFSFVCGQIGKSRGYLAEILAGERDIPEKMLEPVANALGVTVEELTGETEQKEKPSTPEGDGLDEQAKSFAEKLMQLDEPTRTLFNSMLDAAIAVKLKKNG